MNCENVKRKRLGLLKTLLKTLLRALITAISPGIYLIFSSGSSVFIPIYSGILSGNAPV